MAVFALCVSCKNEANRNEDTLVVEQESNIDKFVIEEAVDEFGDKTDTKILVYETYGTYSNDSKTDGKLKVVMSFTRYSYRLKLYEDGEVLLKGHDKYTCELKDRNGETSFEKMKNGIYADYLESEYRGNDDVIGVLDKGGVVSFYIQKNSAPYSNYKFKINAERFKELKDSVSFGWY